MSENGNNGVATVESINNEISTLRESRTGWKRFDNTDAKGQNDRLSALYKQREELAGTGNQMHSEATGVVGPAVKAAMADVKRENTVQGSIARDEANSAEGVLAAAKEAGLDFSDVSAEKITDAERDGIQNLTYIKTGDFKSLAPKLVSAAQELGFPQETISFMEQFTANIAQKGDPLSDRVLEVINEYILEQRSVS